MRVMGFDMGYTVYPARLQTEEEKDYIENFMNRLSSTTIFNGKKCLCHNDFSCNHLLLDDNNRLVGVIDFGDSGIIDEYCDFIYLLEDSEEEIGMSFGEDILELYDPNIYYNQIENMLITTYNKHIAILKLNENKINIKGSIC